MYDAFSLIEESMTAIFVIEAKALEVLSQFPSTNQANFNSLGNKL